MTNSGIPPACSTRSFEEMVNGMMLDSREEEETATTLAEAREQILASAGNMGERSPVIPAYMRGLALQGAALPPIESWPGSGPSAAEASTL